MLDERVTQRSKNGFFKGDQKHTFQPIVACQKSGYFRDRHGCGVPDRVAKRTAADRGEGDGLNFVLNGECEGAVVAAGE